jgi:hypothetical protein
VFDLILEKVELGGTKTINYTDKYQLFNFSKSLLSGKIFAMHIKLRFLTSFEMTINELCEEGRVGWRLSRQPTLPSSRLL